MKYSMKTNQKNNLNWRRRRRRELTTIASSMLRWECLCHYSYRAVDIRCKIPSTSCHPYLCQNKWDISKKLRWYDSVCSRVCWWAYVQGKRRSFSLKLINFEEDWSDRKLRLWAIWFFIIMLQMKTCIYHSLSCKRISDSSTWK